MILYLKGSKTLRLCRPFQRISRLRRQFYNKQCERDVRKITHSQLIQKTKYLRINFTKEVKDLYNKSYKTLKKNEEDVRR
jgi:hypothetical protein